VSALVEIDHVHRHFALSEGLFRRSRVLKAVDGVSLQIAQGEMVALVGESGCGKSTLAKLLLGLLPPSSGHVRIGGQDIRSFDRLSVARRIQPIFQDPYSSLNPRRTVGATIGLPLVVLKLCASRGDVRRRVGEMMERVGLSPQLADRYPSQLSGGQRQRVAIARALIAQPEIVVCDEPTSALDVSVQAQILNLLEELRKELGLTYLFISHNLAVVQHLATRIAVMYLGRIVEEADVATLFASPRHPYTQALLASVLTAEPGLGVPLVPLGSRTPNSFDPLSGCAFAQRCPSVMPMCGEADPGLRPEEGTSVACHLYGS
jgi:peptide/nickel transport system ATP-binding protein